MRVRLGSLATVLLVTSCAAAPAVPPTANPSATPSQPPQMSPSTSPPASLAAASPSPMEQLGVGDVGEIVASNLRLRAAPGVDSEVLGTAMQWWYGWIHEGPIEVDGFIWYRVELTPTAQAPFGCEPSLGNCVSMPGEGWIAVGPPDGAGWFVPVPCPSLPTSVGALASVHHLLLASCFGSDPMSLNGSLTNECVGSQTRPSIEPAWLADFCWRLTSPSDEVVWVHFREAPPAVPAEITLIGHVNDPDAMSCVAAEPDGASDQQAIRMCRSSFVVDEWAYAE